ncbi:hypothetical protein CBM2615_A240336 [Cupriavidus taiwanensis]|uniref:Uncharacterized protein n=1 Tax=Cupriavidus taiwanensis TaxID=164546 RepID=A0A976AVK6_9BURK|nr:hypothetical protein CBM2615_A240336 [Cupriavidus taiwanensis]SOZ54247.1 hypothetical protein CBM2614_A210338 [Cupriavidus taiwanensis]SOZ56613.1 hypothetical protein CBM2613_A220332 [Cupriavidus taiwanensis]SPA04894.1 hypothetical protein CBM2625_A170331 [Cupriavidus taiwanensis]
MAGGLSVLGGVLSAGSRRDVKYASLWGRNTLLDKAPTPFPKYLFFCHNPGLPVIGKWFVRGRAMPSPLAENRGLQRTGYPTRKDSS